MSIREFYNFRILGKGTCAHPEAWDLALSVSLHGTPGCKSPQDVGHYCYQVVNDTGLIVLVFGKFAFDDKIFKRCWRQ